MHSAKTGVEKPSFQSFEKEVFMLGKTVHLPEREAHSLGKESFCFGKEKEKVEKKKIKHHRECLHFPKENLRKGESKAFFHEKVKNLKQKV